MAVKASTQTEVKVVLELDLATADYLKALTQNSLCDPEDESPTEREMRMSVFSTLYDALAPVGCTSFNLQVPGGA